MLSEVGIFREHLDSSATLDQPATNQEIAEFEAHYKIKFPPDVREYFLKLNGVYIGSGFIALESLINWHLLVEDEYISAKFTREILTQADQYFKFGNYGILNWSWSIRLNPNPALETPIVVIDQTATKVAVSFTAFLEKFRTYGQESLF